MLDPSGRVPSGGGGGGMTAVPKGHDSAGLPTLITDMSTPSIPDCQSLDAKLNSIIFRETRQTLLKTRRAL